MNKEFIPLNIAILTASNTRTLKDDKSGDILETRLKADGHNLAAREIIKDDRIGISAQLVNWCDNPNIDVVISTGGTGLTGFDVTVEAHQEIYEKEITAFGTIFALISYDIIGTSAVQSRACAGIRNKTFLFALPGSPGACKDGWDKILSKQLDYRHQPCNFVEILPRLDEHLRRKI